MARLLPLAAVALLLGAVPAVAQIRVPGPITTPDGQRSTNRPAPAARPSPSGVPGARADTDTTAPAERVPADMPPTEALFDAVNRGDLAGVKEAISRGADLHGQNVLGLTPLELSVDLGRSNITFLLLSYRGEAGFSTTSGPGAPAAAPTAAQLRADRRAEEQARRQQAAADRVALRTSRQGPAPARTPRLFAGDGGAPVPQAGFLGFDSGR